MKTVKFFVFAVMAMFLFSGSYAQTGSKTTATKTESLKISGNCGMCKERIEKAAKVEGVTKADWDKTKKILTLVYNPAVVKSDEIQKKIAAVGHDTGKYKADDKTYNSLHSCCKYR